MNDTRRGRRRRCRRSLRRSRRKQEKFTNVTIYNNNLNGYNGKKASIAELLRIVEPSIVTFQETAVTGSNRIKQNNYLCFQRNRKGCKTMGGVATFVANELKQNVVKIKEGLDNDEYLITRLDHVSPPINIMNVYGGQESRMSKQEILENWARMKAEIMEIKNRDEGLVLIGDFNRAVGSDRLGVRGNHDTVSYGGEMIRELLEDEEYLLINNSDTAEGGPFTWVSRVDSSIQSCLDLVILSSNLVPFVTTMIVDSKQKYCPRRVGVRKDKTRVVKPDHHPIILHLENMPKNNQKVAKSTRWNVHKPGGWEAYMKISDEVSQEADKIIEDKNLTKNQIMKKFDNLQNSVKYRAFGKTKPMTNAKRKRRLEERLKAAEGLDEDDKVKEVMRKQYDEMEEKINDLKSFKYGRATNVFKMREEVAGTKKAPQEPHAVLDVKTGDMVVSNKEIKEVTLEHCLNTFKNNKPEEDVKPLVDLMNKLHEKRMAEDDEEPMEITKDEFNETVAKFEKKGKHSYDFLTKSGNSFKNSVFKLCKLFIDDEEFPDRFFETILHQCWKHKFPIEDLCNHRYLHIKDWLPKCTEALVVNKMKPCILKSGTKYQIGGLPHHRVEEHLVTIKAIVSRSSTSTPGGGAIVKLVDIKGFFDSEYLRGVMNSLQEAKIPKKAYRNWFLLNSKTSISIKTPSGQTKFKEAGELCGQGSGGAALASQLDIDLGVNSYFKSSNDEVKFGSVRIQPQEYQDDIAHAVPDVTSARIGNIKMSMMLRERLLRCHPKKTCYLVYGSKSYKRKVREELEICPLMFGDFEMKEQESDVYLGDVLHSGGLAASVEATIKLRISKVKGQMYEVAAILADYRIQAMGGMAGAWDMWERMLVPKLLANCGSWVGSLQKHYDTLNDLQNLFCRLVYACPDSTPLPALRGEAGLLGMKHRVWTEKVCLVTRIFHLYVDEDNYARDILKEQYLNGWVGLSEEVVTICKTVGLPNACDVYVDRKEVKEAMLHHHLINLKQEMKELKKLDRISSKECRYMQGYMLQKSLEDARLEFRWRTGMIDCRAWMPAKYGGEKACTHCRAGREAGEEESGVHWLTCDAYSQLRQGLDPELVDTDRLCFLRKVQLVRAELEK